MDLNQIWNLFLRTVLRRGMNWGINKGIDYASGKRGAGRAQGQGGDNAQARQARDMAKRARKAAQLTRRIGR